MSPDELKLAELLCARLCHDLAGPVGAVATGAELLLGGDLGCLMNMAGKLHRTGSGVRAFHTAEILAGMGTGPAIGELP